MVTSAINLRLSASSRRPSLRTKSMTAASGLERTSPVKVSWQVTGVRQDAYAKAYPLVVEQDKPVAERGYYLHPELFGQPESRGISYVRKLAAEEKKRAEDSHPELFGAAADKQTDALLQH